MIPKINNYYKVKYWENQWDIIKIIDIDHKDGLYYYKVLETNNTDTSIGEEGSDRYKFMDLTHMPEYNSLLWKALNE